MKKLFLTAALAFTFATQAAVITTVNTQTITAEQEKEYKKVEVSTVPAEVVKQAEAKFAGHKISEAHVAADGEYKLVLTKDGKSVTAYYTSKGEFIK